MPRQEDPFETNIVDPEGIRNPKFDPIVSQKHRVLTGETYALDRKLRLTLRLSLIGFLVMVVVGGPVSIYIYLESRKQVTAMEDFDAEGVDNFIGFDPEPVAEAFLVAETLEEKLRYVRHPDRVRLLMREFYKYRPDTRDKTFGGLSSFGGIEGENFIKFRYKVLLESGPRLLSVVKTPEGAKVDWECFSRYQPISWTDILDGKPLPKDGVPCRFALSRSDVFHSSYPDPETHLCFKVHSPDLPRDLYAYAELNSAVQKELEVMLPPGRRMFRRFIGMMGDPRGSAIKGQLELLKIVELGWVDFEGDGSYAPEKLKPFLPEDVPVSSDPGPES